MIRTYSLPKHREITAVREGRSGIYTPLVGSSYPVLRDYHFSQTVAEQESSLQQKLRKESFYAVTRLLVKLGGGMIIVTAAILIVT